MNKDVPDFLRAEDSLIYRVCIRNVPLDVPDPLDGPRRQIVTLPSRFTMRPASSESCYLPSLPRLATMLESRATHVYDTMFKTHYRWHDLMSAYAVMAWYLLYSRTDIRKLLAMSDELHFTDLDVAVWTVVAVFWNMFALCDHLSKRAMSIYNDCLYQLLEIFHVCDFRVRAIYTPR